MVSPCRGQGPRGRGWGMLLPGRRPGLSAEQEPVAAGCGRGPLSFPRTELRQRLRPFACRVGTAPPRAQEPGGEGAPSAPLPALPTDAVTARLLPGRTRTCLLIPAPEPPKSPSDGAGRRGRERRRGGGRGAGGAGSLPAPSSQRGCSAAAAGVSVCGPLFLPLNGSRPSRCCPRNRSPQAEARASDSFY